MSETCPRCGLTGSGGRLEACPRCLLEGDLPPALLGDSLELIEEIGRGGMGHVWKARHLRLERLVAVKFLAEPLASQSDAERRFQREAQVLARLSHPGIVAVYDFARDGDRSYIVMEYVQGTALAASLPLPPDRAHAIALEVLDALAAAHRAGIVHRDVKPANVLLDQGGHAKVSDFGLARLQPGPLDAGVSATTLGRIAGTPRYMAPEALAGAPPDPRMDVFSMGVVLYEMVTGKPPVGGLIPLPPPLDEIVRKALSPDPAQRFADAGEMRAALAAAAPSGAGELPAHEWNWLRAVALVHTLASAVVLWAFLLSVTPKVLPPGDLQPLIMLGTERLGDGRLVSRARFETWPTLAAVAAIVLALAADGTLRRHWREAGLDRPQPTQAVWTSWAVLGWGAIGLTLYLLRMWLGGGIPGGLTAYVPIMGGLIELAMLFVAWVTILEARRRSRPLIREAPLWAGLALALVPPARDLAVYLRDWRP